MPIKHKRTNDPAYVWDLTDLQEGQIGVNIANGTLHIRNYGANTIDTIRKITNVSQLSNDAGYLTSFTETDPTVPSHVKSITTGNISTWNSALQSGQNISLLTNDAGYITSAGAPVQSVNGFTGTVSLTTTNISEGTNQYYTDARARGAISVSGSLNYNATTGVLSYTQPTNVSSFTNDAGYLTSFTETDPTVPSHVKSITTTEKSNWNTAYSWGNHASAGYLTSLNLDGLTDVTITTPSTDQVLKYNGTTWVNASAPAGATNLDGLTDVILTAPTSGQVLKYDGTNWINAADAGGGSGGTPGGVTGQFQFNSADTFAGSSLLTTDGTKVVVGNIRVTGQQIIHDTHNWSTGASYNLGTIRIGNGDGSNTFTTNSNARDSQVLIESTAIADGTQSSVRRTGISAINRTNASVTPGSGYRVRGAVVRTEWIGTGGYSGANWHQLQGAAISFENSGSGVISAATGLASTVASLSTGSITSAHGVFSQASVVGTSPAGIDNFYAYTMGATSDNGSNCRVDNIYGFYIPGNQNTASSVFNLSANLDATTLINTNTYGIYNDSNKAVHKLGGIREAHETYLPVTHSSATTLALDTRMNTCFEISMSANITGLSFSNVQSGRLIPVTIIFKQDATGGRTVSWPAGTKFAGGVTDITTTANAITFASVLIYAGVANVTLVTFE